jgi:protein-S-isoprenylcysteine O-methyltransferase Ste14
MLLRSLILIGIYYIIREFLYCYGCSILLGMSMLLRSPILLGNFYIIILLGIFYFNRDFFLYHYAFVFLYY